MRVYFFKYLKNHGPITLKRAVPDDKGLFKEMAQSPGDPTMDLNGTRKLPFWLLIDTEL